MDFPELARASALTTRAKGFDLSAHATLVAMIAVEAAEALEHVTSPADQVMARFIRRLRMEADVLQGYRWLIRDYRDGSRVAGEEDLLGELADVVLRVATYVGAHGLEERFWQMVVAKAEYNRGRPWRHDRGF